ncbi:LuxR C-terminal-related transcriptional regulator [Planococcus sp. APC 4015]|nr:LuxR C-terminal-related transcriptional regulator [Planococcus sp. APC 4015]
MPSPTNADASRASPRYLRESRAAASARSELVNEFADRQTTMLESLLAILRSKQLDDAAARRLSIRLAAEALVALRVDTDHVLTLGEEPVTTAFQRLRDDLAPIVRHRRIDMQFVEPPVNGRALPPEIAHGARAVVRDAVLALTDQSDVTRVRVQWDCDGTNLLIDVRDDGAGLIDPDDGLLEPLRHRIVAMRGRLDLEATAGWGSKLAVVVPLDPPVLHSAAPGPPALSAREKEVLELMVRGARNRQIAEALAISDNTVKFHVSRILRKWGARSRAEVIAVALDRGLGMPAGGAD